MYEHQLHAYIPSQQLPAVVKSTATLSATIVHGLERDICMPGQRSLQCTEQSS